MPKGALFRILFFKILDLSFMNSRPAAKNHSKNRQSKKRRVCREGSPELAVAMLGQGRQPSKNVARGTGCAIDKELVWTSEQCEEGGVAGVAGCVWQQRACVGLPPARKPPDTVEILLPLLRARVRRNHRRRACPGRPWLVVWTCTPFGRALVRGCPAWDLSSCRAPARGVFHRSHFRRVLCLEHLGLKGT